MLQPNRHLLLRYGSAVVSVALMTLVRFALAHLMGQRQPFITF